MTKQAMGQDYGGKSQIPISFVLWKVPPQLKWQIEPNMTDVRLMKSMSYQPDLREEPLDMRNDLWPDEGRQNNNFQTGDEFGEQFLYPNKQDWNFDEPRNRKTPLTFSWDPKQKQ